MSSFHPCAEIITDQGIESQGEFEELIEASLMDHRIRTIPASHPHANCLPRNHRDLDLRASISTESVK